MGVLFAAAVAVAVFAYLSVVQWTNARTAERNARERLVLMGRLAEQPAEGVKLVLELLREDDRRAEEEQRQRRRQEQQGGMQAGVVLITVGAGLALFLYSVTKADPDAAAKNVWTLGLLPLMLGLVFMAFSLFKKADPE